MPVGRLGACASVAGRGDIAVAYAAGTAGPGITRVGDPNVRASIAHAHFRSSAEANVNADRRNTRLGGNEQEVAAWRRFIEGAR